MTSTETDRDVYIGSRIVSARRMTPRYRGIVSQQALSNLTGIPPRRLWQIENGHQSADMDEVCSIARFLGFDLLWFFPQSERELTADDLRDSRSR